MNKWAAMGMVLLALSPIILMVIDGAFHMYRTYIKGEESTWM